MALYLCSLLAIGWFAKKASIGTGLNDYYLAGGSLGALPLFFTLYATQYSGNSLFALPGKAYRDGILAGAFVVGIMGVVLVYKLYANRLHSLAKEHQFLTVADFVRWRYNSSALVMIVNILLTLTLITFILGNLKAVGLLLNSELL